MRIGQNRVGKYHRNAPDTEQEAAVAVKPRSGKQRQRVYDYIVSRGGRGATDWEISEALEMSRTGAGARRNELMNAGYVRDSKWRRISGPYHQKGIVWIAT